MTKFFSNLNQRVVIWLLAAFLSTNAFAQLPMTRSINFDPLVPITVLGGATASTAIGDDAIQTALPIGFSFNYLGTGYTTFSVCSNGWLSFTATAQTATNTNLFTVAAPGAVLAPWWDDLTTSEILYQTTGPPGSQICVIQWTSLSYFSVSTRTITYQVILYEGTNEIDFVYGPAPTGTISNSESASIGIKSVTGGNGQYLDAVTGGFNVGNATLQSTRWPAYNFRFSPGAPPVLPGGTYNVGLGQTYINLNEAVADINHRGISGSVTLNLTDALYDITPAGGSNFFPILLGVPTGLNTTNRLTITKTGSPAVINYGGTTGGSIANQVSGTAISGTTAEPIIGLVGTDFVTISNLDLRSPNPGTADFGIGLYNGLATDGATNNVIQNVSVSMNRANTSSRGFVTAIPTAPTSAAGANSNNTFRNFSITSVYAGIQMTGNATNPDINNVITNTVCTNFNTIGDPGTSNDIGNGTVQTFGIRATNQSGFSISNNEISNVTGSNVVTDGIFVETFQGAASLFNNKVRGIRNASATSTTGISGIRATHTTTGTHTLRIYNNTVSEITSAYTGVASATRTLKGIFIASAGGGLATQNYQVFNNSVSIDGSSSPNLSSTCYEIGTTTGPVFTVGNNIFANFTAAQTGLARHFAVFSTSATLAGNTGSAYNNNDYFILNDAGTSGFVGLGNAVTFTTLADWQTAMTQDAASVSLNPNYINNSTNLHAGNLGLNGAGQAYPVYLTQDLDCAARTDSDLGAYIINGCSGLPVSGTITGVNSVCTGTGTLLTLTGASADAGITYQWGSSTVSGGPYTNLGTTNIQATGALSTTTFYAVTVSCSVSGLSTVTTEKQITIDALPTISVSPTTSDLCLPAGGSVALTASGSSVSYVWSPSAGLSATTGISVTATPTSTRVYTVQGTGANGCFASATATVNVNLTPAISSVTASPSDVCVGASSQLAASAALPALLISEVTVFRAGTGQTAPYPAYATGQDLVEISNITSSPVDISGYVLSAFANNGATASHTITFPVGTIIPANAVAVVCLGVGTDDLLNRYFNTGGASDSYSSSSQVGIVLYNGSLVVDAVGLGGSLTGSYTFNAATNVTASDFTGFAPNGGGLAGSNRTTATDNNIGTDWTASGAANVQTIGTYNPIFASPGTITYNWSPAGNLSASNISNPVASNILATTVYNVTATSNGCNSTSAVTVTAGAAFSASASTTTPLVCEAVNVTLEATPIGGGGPYTYSWSGPASFTSAAQNPVLTATTVAMSGSYTVTITDNCGATATASTSLAVNAIPAMSVSPSSSTYCTPGGAAVMITASGADTYAWSPATGLSATTGFTVDATPISSTTYTVVGTIVATGCTASLPSVVAVAEIPSILSISASPSSVCANGSSQLNVFAATTSAYTVSAIPFAAAATPGTGVTALSSAGTAVTALSAGTLDDGGWESQPIPFNFVFYGISYNSFAVSTNGFISLGAGAPTTYTGYGNTFPTVASARPSIGATYSDLDFRTVGNISYFVTGTAPNRQLVVNWTGGNFYNAVGAITTQLIIYETTNIIEVHTTNSSGTNTAVQGIQNAAGTTASVVSGRNGVAWPVSTPDAYRWSPSGGTPTYVWSPAATLDNAAIANPLASNIASTTVYTVTATSNGCASTNSVTVTTGVPLSASANNATPTICEANNVNLESTPIAGGGPFTYAWSGPASFTSIVQNPVLTSVTTAMTGSYTVTITDNCGATATASTSLTVNAIPTMSVAPSSSTYCTPGGTAVTLIASGADTYAWSPATGLSATTGSTVNATPAASVTYTVVGTTAANGCTASTASVVAAVQQPTMGAVTATPAAICIGGNSQLTAAASIFYNQSASVYSFTGSTGTYTPITGTSVAVIGDDIGVGNLPIGFTFNYAGSPNTVFSVNSNGYIVLGQTTTTNAFGNNLTATANVIAALWDDNNTTGGTVTYATTGTSPNQVLTVQWTGMHVGGGGSAANPTIDCQVLFFEATGQIQIIYGSTSAALAATTASIGISSAVGSYLSVSPLSPANTSTVSSIAENNAVGSAVDFPSGTVYTFTPPVAPTLAYSWSPATFLGSTTGASVTASGVSAATTYTVSANNSGCIATGTISIAVSNPFLNAIANPTTCLASDGSATVSSTNGVAPYSFAWSNGATSATVSALAVGSYTVSVTDAIGCQNSLFINVNANNIALNNTANTTAATCLAADGTATVSTSNGLSPFSYLWSNGQTTATASGLAAANYTVTVTDANGCVGTSSTTVTVGSGTLAATAASTSATCLSPNGTATATITGGTAPFTTLWSNGGNTTVITGLAAGAYSVTVTDANGCVSTASTTVTTNSGTLATTAASTSATCLSLNGTATATITGGTAPFTTSWSNAGNTTALTGLAAGAYSVTVTDANGCVSTASTTVTTNTGNLVATVTPADAICTAANGTATATNTGGTAPFSYVWNNSATTSSLTGLLGGTFAVTMTDANGCQSTASAIVATSTGNLTAAATTTQELCTSGNGTATITPAGGTAPFGFVWSNGATDATANGLSAGAYTATVTDANGCVESAAVTIGINSGTLTATTSTTNANCLAADGTVTATAANGSAPFDFIWNNGSTTATATGAAGTYNVTVTDADGCITTATATVIAGNGGLIASATASNTICTSATGTTTATTTGGTAPFSFVWNNAATTSALNNLAAGTYSVTATDANGCVNTATATVGTNAGTLATSATATDATVNGAADGSADVTVTGGTSPITYLWSNAATTEDLNGLTAGTYTVTVTDANGCISTETVTVSQPPVAIDVTAANAWTANMFPNPAENQTMIAVELGTISNVRIRLVNNLGQIIQSVEYSDVMSVQHSLNVSELPAAVYMVEISANGQLKTQRLFVARK
jgi:hypothetical protein